MNQQISSASFTDSTTTRVVIYYEGGNDVSWVNYGESEELEKWISEGNIIGQYEEPEEVQLTPQQKLEAAGLSIEELKELLGL